MSTDFLKLCSRVNDESAKSSLRRKAKPPLEMMKAREKGEVWGQESPSNSPATAGPSSVPSSPVQLSSNDGTMVNRESSTRTKRFSLVEAFKNYRNAFPASESSYSESSSSLSSNADIPRLTEDEEDINDALSPVYDQLALVKWWWILEFWPISERKKKKGEWKKEVT